MTNSKQHGARSARIQRPALVVVLVLSLVAAACGSSGGDESAADSAQRLMIGAAQRTFTAGTAQVSVVITGLSDEITGSGAVDFVAGQSEVTVSLPDGLAGGGDFGVTIDGADTFLFPAALLGTDGAVASDATDGAQQAALEELNQILILLQPDQLLAALGGTGGDATADGDNAFDGTVDLEAAADELTGAEKDAFLAAIAALDDKNIEVHVTLDEEGRVVELEAEITLNNGDTVTGTVTYSAFGEPVDIEIPDPEDLSSFESTSGPTPPDTTATTIPAGDAFGDLDGIYAVTADGIPPGTIAVTCSSATTCTVVDQAGVTAEASRAGLVLTLGDNGTCGGYIWTFTAEGGVSGEGTGCVAGLPGTSSSGQRTGD